MTNGSPILFDELVLAGHDCCNTYRVECSDSRVTEIYWDTWGLNGTINGTSLNMLTNLERLYIQNNYLSGTPPSSFPESLIHLNIGVNRFSGALVSMPSNLQYFHADYNFLTGDMPKIPDSMLDLRFDVGNQFTGAVHLQKPIQLVANGNRISRVCTLKIFLT